LVGQVVARLAARRAADAEGRTAVARWTAALAEGEWKEWSGPDSAPVC
jgi:hypothetical protein